MKRILWITILFSLWLQACQKKSSEIGTDFFEKTGQVSVTTGSGQFPRLSKSLTNHVFDANDLVACLPKGDSAIRIYSMFRDSLIKSIPLDSVFSRINSNYFDITGYYFQSQDSIYLASRNEKAFLLNGAGKVLDSIIFQDSVNSKPLNITGYEVHPYKENGHFYLSNQYANYNYSTDSAVRRIYFNTPLEAVMDAKTGERIATNLHYPAFYRNGKFYRSSSVSRTINEEENLRIYSFHYSDSIYVVTDEATKAYYASSPYFEHPAPYIGDSIRNRAYWKKFATVNAKFVDIYYDPYRQLYYRVLKHPVPVKAGKDRINTPINAKYSLIILDDKFEKIYEQVFESNIYFYYEDLIISKNGILIPLHPQNPNNKRGVWNYDLFKAKEYEINS